MVKLLRRRWLSRAVALILMFGLGFGGMLAQAMDRPSDIKPGAVGKPSEGSQPTPVSQLAIGTMDIVPPNLQAGQALYLENCATCHIALPPAVMPTQTWQVLIQDPQHYGATIEPLKDPGRRLLWNYLKFASRPTNGEEELPYRIGSARYFKALHPKVKLPSPLKLESCIQCHTAAPDFDFRNGLKE
jgi:hypothetical protein